MRKNLFTYPGSKAWFVPELKADMESYPYSALLDPFVGSAPSLVACAHLVPEVICADSDKAVRAVIQVARDPIARAVVYDRVEEIRARASDEELALIASTNPSTLEAGVIEIAVHKLVCQSLVYGGIYRTCVDGITPNVKVSKEKLERFRRNGCPLPAISRHSSLTCLDNCSDVPAIFGAIAVIDPPYYHPKCQRCYPGHNPGDPKTLDAGLDRLHAYLLGGVKTIYYFNYDTPYLRERLEDIGVLGHQISTRFVNAKCAPEKLELVARIMR